MTHAEYLEAYHELMTKALPELALSVAKGEFAFVQACMIVLQTKTDAMWEERVATAEREVGQ